MTVGEALLDLTIWLLGSVIVVGIPIALFVSIWVWCETLGREKPLITFKEFIKLYNANPDKWSVARENNPMLDISRVDRWSKEYVHFKFNYIDFYRYKLWQMQMRRECARQKAQRKYDEAMAALREDVQKLDREIGVEVTVKGKDPRIKALAKDIVDYWNMTRKEK